MGRHIKEGLDYFPFGVDFFEDDKIQLVSSRFQEKGELIAVKLLCKIYKDKGYYYQWGEDEAMLFAKRVGGNCPHSLVNDVVHELVKRGFFDRSIFDRLKILTSNGIQKRYLSICQAAKRKGVKILPELNLLKFTREFLELTPEEIANTPEEMQQRKESKEIKEKKVKEIPPEIFGEKIIYDPEVILEKFLSNEGWIYNTSKFFKFTREKTEEMVARFLEEQNLKHNLARSLAELMDHFISWAKKPDNQNNKTVNGFPNSWSAEFEKKLDSNGMKQFWAHLRSQGLQPKKVNGKTVDWVKIVQYENQ